MKRYLLTVAYKGTNYAGWQRQDNANTVQEEVERALSELYKQPVTVLGASRTDAGVHALGQACAFSVVDDFIPVDKLPLAVNANLPPDIAVTAARAVCEEFHPIFDAKNKTYVYRIYADVIRHPLVGDTSWHVYQRLDIDAMREAAAFFVGEHDFSAFCAANGGAKTFVRKVNSSEVYLESGDESNAGYRGRSSLRNMVCFRVNGDGFLYNMVRIMAGTLVYVGQGKIKADDVPGIIASKDRTRAGITAPPEGLCLIEVFY